MSSLAQSEKTRSQKDSTAKSLAPVAGKAIVYIIRPSLFGAAVRMKVFCDSNYVGYTYSRQYVYTIVDSGFHTFVSKAESKSPLQLYCEGGKIYYLKQEVEMGLAFAETELELQTVDGGKQMLQKCMISKNNVLTNDTPDNTKH